MEVSFSFCESFLSGELERILQNLQKSRQTAAGVALFAALQLKST